MKKKENKFKIRAHVQLEYFRTFDLCGVFLLCILKPKQRLESNNLLKFAAEEVHSQNEPGGGIHVVWVVIHFTTITSKKSLSSLIK